MTVATPKNALQSLKSLRQNSQACLGRQIKVPVSDEKGAKVEDEDSQDEDVGNDLQELQKLMNAAHGKGPDQAEPTQKPSPRSILLRSNSLPKEVVKVEGSLKEDLTDGGERRQSHGDAGPAFCSKSNSFAGPSYPYSEPTSPVRIRRQLSRMGSLALGLRDDGSFDNPAFGHDDEQDEKEPPPVLVMPLLLKPTSPVAKSIGIGHSGPGQSIQRSPSTSSLQGTHSSLPAQSSGRVAIPRASSLTRRKTEEANATAMRSAASFTLPLMVMEKFLGRGWSDPLHQAAFEGRDILVENLLEGNGARVNQLNEDGLTPLHLAAQEGHSETVALLLRKGASIQARNTIGRTALHLAAFDNHEATVAVLINDANCFVDDKDTHGNTALHLAARQGHFYTCYMLLEKRADMNLTDKHGGTAMLWAAYGGHVAIVNQLLDRGADINRKDNSWSTALHLSAFQGHMNVVGLLLGRGADFRMKDVKGRRCIERARLGGHEHVMALLQSYEATDPRGSAPSPTASPTASPSRSPSWFKKGMSPQASPKSSSGDLRALACALSASPLPSPKEGAQTAQEIEGLFERRWSGSLND